VPDLEQGKAAFQFGAFELDTRTGELRKHGVRVKLQQQPIQVLSILLEHAGEVVTRQELQRRLWPENTYVDFDNAINSAVRKLRDALSENADAPRYFETLSRRGYRFIAPVSQKQTTTEPVAKPQHSEPEALVKSPQRSTTFRKRWLIASAAIVLTIMGAGLGLWFADSANRSGENPLIPVPFTSYPGFQTMPSISPEGTRVAFAWQQPDKQNTELFVKLIGGGEPVRLSNAGGSAPAWSPDGRQIAFLRSSKPLHASVMVTSALGGQEREITHINILGGGNFNFGGWISPAPFLAWSRDREWLLTLDQRSDGYQQSQAIIRVSVETGEKRILTTPPPGNSGDGGIALSADNKKLAFTRETGLFFRRDIYVVPLSGEMIPTEEPKRITFDNRRIDGLAWASDGQHLLFSSSRRGRQELWKVAATPGSVPVRLNIAADEPNEFAISLDGKRLIYAHQFEDLDIWQTSIKGDSLSGSKDLISSTRRDGQPQYSPDGQRIAFESDRSGHEEIWVCHADGSNPVQLTHFETAWAGAPRWSPDGKEIAFAANAAGSWDIYVIRSQGGSPRHFTSGNADESWPSWSHDGQWIYYFSNRTGEGQIWKMRTTGGPEVQVTKNGGYYSFESPDGAYLYYATERGFWAIPLRGGQEIEIARLLDAPDLAFASAKEGVYFLENRWNQPHAILNFFNMRNHTKKEIGLLPGPFEWGISISPDGQRLLHGKVERRGSELMLIENFQ
jgi:Tol biopolymer transport system component/DNA-binding winged helix-turn-helix (wHTH) protein